MARFPRFGYKRRRSKKTKRSGTGGKTTTTTLVSTAFLQPNDFSSGVLDLEAASSTASSRPDSTASSDSNNGGGLLTKISSNTVERSLSALQPPIGKKTVVVQRITERRHVENPLAYFEQLSDPENYRLPNFNEITKRNLTTRLVGIVDTDELERNTPFRQQHCADDVSIPNSTADLYQNLPPESARFGNMSTARRDTKNFLCGQCHVLFDDYASYDVHVRQVHFDDPEPPQRPLIVPARCDGNLPVTIGPRFRFPTCIPEPQGPWRCTRCSKSDFTSASELHEHIVLCAEEGRRAIIPKTASRQQQRVKVMIKSEPAVKSTPFNTSRGVTIPMVSARKTLSTRVQPKNGNKAPKTVYIRVSDGKGGHRQVGIKARVSSKMRNSKLETKTKSRRTTTLTLKPKTIVSADATRKSKRQPKPNKFYHDSETETEY